MKKHTQRGRHRGKPVDRDARDKTERRVGFSPKLAILYEDDAVVVLDKPAGLLAVPIKGSSTPSALTLLSSRLSTKKQRALVVHRIDRFATGALLFAKTPRDRATLIRQFLDHTPVREYLVVVRGHLGSQSGTLVHHFSRQGMYQQQRSASDPKASRAELRFIVEQTFPKATLVRVQLVTGLQNQIRAQFAAEGHPVIGDRKYRQSESSEKLIDRVALHATHLEFVHPRTEKTVVVDCPPPADFRNLLEGLSRSNPRGRI
jgi:23S rRNA pseudouridine1911/1915/1917 synthase